MTGTIVSSAPPEAAGAHAHHFNNIAFLQEVKCRINEFAPYRCQQVPGIQAAVQMLYAFFEKLSIAPEEGRTKDHLKPKSFLVIKIGARVDQSSGQR